jgi:hypothetical protein
LTLDDVGAEAAAAFAKYMIRRPFVLKRKTELTHLDLTLARKLSPEEEIDGSGYIYI